MVREKRFQEKTFWLLLVSLMITGFALSPFLNRAHVFRLARAADVDAPLTQAADQRSWDEDGLGAADLSLRSLPGEPGLMTIDRDGHILLADYEEMQIEELSPAGELLHIWGDGMGELPGQLTNPSSLALDAHGDL